MQTREAARPSWTGGQEDRRRAGRWWRWEGGRRLKMCWALVDCRDLSLSSLPAHEAARQAGQEYVPILCQGTNNFHPPPSLPPSPPLTVPQYAIYQHTPCPASLHACLPEGWLSLDRKRTQDFTSTNKKILSLLREHLHLSEQKFLLGN